MSDESRVVSSPSSKVGPALAPPLAKPMATASQRRRARPVFDVDILLSFVVIVFFVRLQKVQAWATTALIPGP
ncbi:hypothetical protein D3C78_1933840 [compost metagenome]